MKCTNAKSLQSLLAFAATALVACSSPPFQRVDIGPVPVTNLLLSVLDKAGVRAEELGDSSGVLNTGTLANL